MPHPHPATLCIPPMKAPRMYTLLQKSHGHSKFQNVERQLARARSLADPALGPAGAGAAAAAGAGAVAAAAAVASAGARVLQTLWRWPSAEYGTAGGGRACVSLQPHSQLAQPGSPAFGGPLVKTPPPTKFLSCPGCAQ